MTHIPPVFPETHAGMPVSPDRSLFDTDMDYFFVTYGPLKEWVVRIDAPGVHYFHETDDCVLEPDLAAFLQEFPGLREYGDEISEHEARAMFREYLAQDCEGSPLTPEDLTAAELAVEWQAWLQQTQIETGFVDEATAQTWTPT